MKQIGFWSGSIRIGISRIERDGVFQCSGRGTTATAGVLKGLAHADLPKNYFLHDIFIVLYAIIM